MLEGRGRVWSPRIALAEVQRLYGLAAQVVPAVDRDGRVVLRVPAIWGCMKRRGEDEV